jgi:peptidoglycan/LPS O-acetylase OafA/YrhL
MTTSVETTVQPTGHARPSPVTRRPEPPLPEVDQSEGTKTRPGFRDHLVYLDGWRGLAIAMVLWAHFGWSHRMDSGRFGVDIFFALSGLLMSNILFVRRTTLSAFYKRRISRILPVFVLFVVAVFALDAVRTGSFLREEFLSTLTFLRTYIPTHPTIWDSRVPIGHIWSLNVEEHSYVFLSLLTVLPFMRDREGPLLMLAGVVSVAIRLAYAVGRSHAPPWGDLGTEAAAAHVLISAGYFIVAPRFRPWVKGWMPPVALLGAGLSYLYIFPWWAHIVVSPFLLPFAANHIADSYRWFIRGLSFRPLTILGLWSYSIYIWQQPFYHLRESWGHGVALAAALVIAILSFTLFENPARRWLNDHW